MTDKVKEFFTELEKYEARGTGSMDWAEWAHYYIDEHIVEKFTVEDWHCVKENYKNKSDNMKALICAHIHLDDINFAPIELELLTEIVKSEPIDIAFKALKSITFGMVTYGIEHPKNEDYHKMKLKGIFLSEKADEIIQKFFTVDFKNKTLQIVQECGEFQKKEILEFLKILENKKAFTNNNNSPLKMG